jgi:hypothetical protein
MKRKIYSLPVVDIIHVDATNALLDGSNEGMIVIPEEPHDPGEAEAQWTNLWENTDEEE